MKYEKAIEELSVQGHTKMKCFGNSMLPILSNPSICYYQKQDTYEVGDIVFCKVKGRYINAHKITKINKNKYLISNNHGWDNGWTNTIYGRVFKTEDKVGRIKEF